MNKLLFDTKTAIIQIKPLPERNSSDKCKLSNKKMMSMQIHEFTSSFNWDKEL